MTDSIWITCAIAGVFLLAGFIKGVIGLGLPTVSIGLLGLLMTPAQAAAVLLVPSFITNLWQSVAGGEVLALMRRLATLLIGICIGTAIGALWLPNASHGQATMWLGVVLALYAVLGLLKLHPSVPLRMEWWLGFVIGAANGAVTVSTGVLALPAVPYIQGMQLTRDRMVQALGISFTTSTVTLAAALGYAGEIHLSLILPSAIALAAALAGMVLGQLLRGRVAPSTFRLCFFIGLLLLGAHLALQGLL